MENDAKKEEKYTKAKKEAVAKVKKELKVRKVTHLYKPALSAGKPPKQAKRVTKK